MDNFSVYGDTFEEALANLEKVLIHYQETNLSLSHEKCRMLFTKGVVLGHIISQNGIEVDPAKIKVISNLSVPQNQKDIRSSFGHVGYYRRFIENFTKIEAPLFKLLSKDVEFASNEQCQSTFEHLKKKFLKHLS